MHWSRQNSSGRSLRKKRANWRMADRCNITPVEMVKQMTIATPNMDTAPNPTSNPAIHATQDPLSALNPPPRGSREGRTAASCTQIHIHMSMYHAQRNPLSTSPRGRDMIPPTPLVSPTNPEILRFSKAPYKHMHSRVHLIVVTRQCQIQSCFAWKSVCS